MTSPIGMQPTGFAPQPTGFSAQPTGFMQSQPTGFMPSQPTGFGGGAMGGGYGGGFGAQPTGFAPQQTGFGAQQTGFMQPQATGFGQPQQQQQQQQQQPVQFNPMPPTSSGPSSNTVASTGATHNAPTNVFAAMKDGTFAAGKTHLPPQDETRYDALRAQPTGFAQQPQQQMGIGMSGMAGGMGMPMGMGYGGGGQMPQMTGFMPQQQQQPYGYQQVRLSPSLLLSLPPSLPPSLLPRSLVLTRRRARSTELHRRPSSSSSLPHLVFPTGPYLLLRSPLSPLSHVMQSPSYPSQ